MRKYMQIVMVFGVLLGLASSGVCAVSMSPYKAATCSKSKALNGIKNVPAEMPSKMLPCRSNDFRAIVPPSAIQRPIESLKRSGFPSVDGSANMNLFGWESDGSQIGITSRQPNLRKSAALYRLFCAFLC
ncbi:MAG: hypothetical protein KFF50_08205, partial [Desulfatitalea sp.]|nr:hypothetical protein [Desulfatitalea sp.]